MENKGISIQDIIDIDMTDVLSFDESTLKKLTNKMVSAANKRLKRLGSSAMGKLSPVYRKTKFSTRGKNRNQLLHEFHDTKTFLTSSTSTVRGWNKERTEIEKRLGGRLPKGKTKKFWRVYRKFSETHYGGLKASKDGSTRMQQYIREMYIDNKIYDEDELLKRAESYLDELYMSSL